MPISGALRDGQWWSKTSPFAVLHLITPLRLTWILQQLQHMPLYKGGHAPLKGMRILDVGCGGGLTAEPLARLGADVMAIDADPHAISSAYTHRAGKNLSVEYQVGTLETLTFSHKFHCILALEIMEHLSSPEDFIHTCSNLLEEGGIFCGSTFHRTWISYVLAIMVAEDILSWVPPGTHTWEHFCTIEDVQKWCTHAQLSLPIFQGITFLPFLHEWIFCESVAVSYMFSAKKKKSL